jgi:hypothetical protein
VAAVHCAESLVAVIDDVADVGPQAVAFAHRGGDARFAEFPRLALIAEPEFF